MRAPGEAGGRSPALADAVPLGTLIPRLLARAGISHVFGIPGVHNMELYRGLPESGLVHVLARHEQGAGFMADGFARVSGRPAAIFVITGPGLLNAMTAMAQARADSVPLLVIATGPARGEQGSGNGYLHEMPDQRAAAAGAAPFAVRLERAEGFAEVLAQAMAAMISGRPAPAYIEIPHDMLADKVEDPGAPPLAIPAPPAVPAAQVRAAARRLQQARRPMILAGGGALGAAPGLRALAERLDAPLVTTIAAKGLLPPGHRLSVGYSPGCPAVRQALSGADLVLAVGTEIGPTDFETGPAHPQRFAELIRIDIDADQLQRNAPPAIAIHAGAAEAVAALLADPALHGAKPADCGGGAERTRALRAVALEALTAEQAMFGRLFATLAGAAGERRIVGDSTLPVYAGNRLHEPARPGLWFNAATGFGTLGYALPAAIGAAVADPATPTICLAGDGGFQFTLPELAVAAELGLPLPVVVWNSHGYAAIELNMARKGIPPVAVSPRPPDLAHVAAAWRIGHRRVRSHPELAAALTVAFDAFGPTLIEIDASTAPAF